MKKKHKQKKQRTKEEETNKVLLEIENDLTNLKLSIDKKDKTIKEYIRLLELAKREYQKVNLENQHLRHQLLIAKKVIEIINK